jgi:hypothetical protein
MQMGITNSLPVAARDKKDGAVNSQRGRGVLRMSHGARARSVIVRSSGKKLGTRIACLLDITVYRDRAEVAERRTRTGMAWHGPCLSVSEDMERLFLG